MGGDSAAVGGYDIRQTALRKVFRRDQFLIGYTDSFRMGQLLQYGLEVPLQAEGMPDEEFMVTVFVEAVRKCLNDSGYSKIENHVERGGQFMAGYRGHLYHIYGDYQVNHWVEGFSACGCGESYALGALAALKGKPEQRIKKALQVAAKFSAGVSGPFYIERLTSIPTIAPINFEADFNGTEEF